jgi:hypothetical protein
MLRHSISALAVLLVLALGVLAADKEVMCVVVKVDAAKKVITVKTDDGKEHNYDVADDTKFLGPKGGVSEKGMKDDRLTKGAQLKLMIAGNNRTIHEVHLPERKGAKDK